MNHLNVKSYPMIARYKGRSIDELIKLREADSDFEYVVNRLIPDVWCKVLKKDDIITAFDNGDAYLVEIALLALEYSKKVKDTTCDVSMFDFDSQFIHCDDLDVNELLVEYNYINVEDEDGNTPLLVACCDINYWRIHFLLKNGAEVNGSCLYNFFSSNNTLPGSDLGRQTEPKFVKVVRSFIEKGACVNPCLTSVCSPELLKLMTKAKDFDIDCQDINGDTLLMISAEITSDVMVKAALDNGADVNRRNRSNQSAFEIAYNSSQTIRGINICLYLMSYEPNITGCNISLLIKEPSWSEIPSNIDVKRFNLFTAMIEKGADITGLSEMLGSSAFHFRIKSYLKNGKL